MTDNNPIFQPQTPANNKLRQDVAPPDWVNPEPADKYNLVVIGAGSGGLVTAAGAAGLKEAGALTNETLFSLTELPRRFAVIGAGPIGCEMAQAFARLGSEVTLFEAQCKILPREDGIALFKKRKKHTDLLVPWCTYTQPEIAHVGLYDGEAKERHGNAVQTFTQDFAEIDRSILEGDTEGFVKMHTVKGKIVGATIVGEHAGDLISEISVAMQAGMKLGSLASVIHPYPTSAEAIRRLGDAYNRTRFTPLLAKLFKKWLGWTR